MIFGRHPHQNEEPWDDAPPWAIELGAIILYTWEQEMAAIDDLKNTAASLTAAVTALTDAVNAKLANPGVTDADLAPVVTDLASAVTAINDAAAKLKPA